MSWLVDALDRAYRVLGLDAAASGDEVFRHLVFARIIEPSSKLDSLRVLEEAGVAPASYRTLKRRLPAYAEEAWRQRLPEACAAHARLGPASLVLYDGHAETGAAEKETSVMPEPNVILSGLGIPESPRWHQGRLWFCNWIDPQVMAVGMDGNPEVILTRDPASHPMGYSIGVAA